MIQIRVTQERIANIYSEGKIRCPVHLCTGQEAVPVGVCSNLSKNDWVFSGHRNHGWYIAKGGNINQLFAELFGKSGGCCRGKGGSMHLAAPDIGFSITSSIVAGTLAQAVGAALTFKMRKKSCIAIANCGDAAVEEGVFFECLNFAKLFSLPVLFCVENNGLSVESQIRYRRAFNLEKVCEGFGVKYKFVDTVDVDEIAMITENIYGFVKGNEPALIEFNVHRFREHVHPPEFSKHLTEEDRERFDPINKHQDKEWVSKIFRESEIIVDKAITFAENSPFPVESDLLQDVYK